MLLSNQQKYILEILKEFKYLRVRQLHALVQPGFYSKDGLHEPFLLRFTGNGKGAGYLFSVAWLDAATHIATVPRMKGERIPTAPADDRSSVCGGQPLFRCCPGRTLC